MIDTAVIGPDPSRRLAALVQVLEAMPREAREVLPDYYEILGVPCDADPAAVKGAFRQRALTTHPDKPGGSDEAQCCFLGLF